MMESCFCFYDLSLAGKNRVEEGKGRTFLYLTWEMADIRIGVEVEYLPLAIQTKH